MKKLIVIFLATALAATCAQADSNGATMVKIGTETWYASDTTKPLPYVFSCGAVLRSTSGGVRLDLNNVTLPSKVWADGGDLSVLLIGDNFSSGGIDNYGYKLTIFGTGSLVISNPLYGAISAGDISIAAGASIAIYNGDSGYGAITANHIAISASAVSIYSDASSIIANSLDIIGSVVVEKCPASGILRTPDSVVIDGSVVCVYSSGQYVNGPVSTFSCTHSYFSSVSCGSHALNVSTAYFDHSIVKLYNKKGNCIEADSADVLLEIRGSVGAKCAIEPDYDGYLGDIFKEATSGNLNYALVDLRYVNLAEPVRVDLRLSGEVGETAMFYHVLGDYMPACNTCIDALELHDF